MVREVSIADGVKQADAELNALRAVEGADGRLSLALTAVATRPSGLRRAQTRAGWLFVLPASLLYAAFVLAPVIVTTILAFAYYDPMMGSYWVGLDNFTRFFTDPRSLQILWNTLRFALFAVTFNVAVGWRWRWRSTGRCRAGCSTSSASPSSSR